MSAEVTICPSCKQEIPGMVEPSSTGTIVACTCGEVYIKLEPAPKANGDWRKVSNHHQAGRSFWRTVLANHNGEGHALSVVRDGAPAVTS